MGERKSRGILEDSENGIQAYASLHERGMGEDLLGDRSVSEQGNLWLQFRRASSLVRSHASIYGSSHPGCGEAPVVQRSDAPESRGRKRYVESVSLHAKNRNARMGSDPGRGRRTF